MGDSTRDKGRLEVSEDSQYYITRGRGNIFSGLVGTSKLMCYTCQVGDYHA